MEITSVTTTIRCLFRPDVIPWPDMLAPSNRAKLQTRYKFNEVRQAADPNGNPVQFLFVGGEFPFFKGTPRAVEQLIFEPVAIQFQLVMNSDEANSFLDDFSLVLAEIHPGGSFWSLAKTKVYQTTAVARLAVKHTSLIAEDFQRFIEETASKSVNLPDAKAQITLERLGWRVTYETQSADFLYLPKALTIEPRSGSKPSDQLYFTRSPVEYKKHLELLAEFEKRLGQKQIRQKRGHKSRAKRRLI